MFISMALFKKFQSIILLEGCYTKYFRDAYTNLVRDKILCWYIMFGSSFPQILLTKSPRHSVTMLLLGYSVWLITDRGWMICFSNVFPRLDNRYTHYSSVYASFLVYFFFCFLLSFYYLRFREYIYHTLISWIVELY